MTEPPAPAPGGPDDPDCRRLLLVDFDHDIRSLMRRFLEMQGFDCRVASDADGALRLCREGDRIDLVVVASHLHADSGFELLARLRRTLPALPLLLLRGLDGVDDSRNEFEAARLGAHFLAKPLHLSSLLEAVVGALAEGLRAAQAYSFGGALPAETRTTPAVELTVQ